jgi:hemin uptake protein HemP
MSSAADSTRELASVVSEADPDDPTSAMIDCSKPIQSDTLFSDGDVVFIEHQGARYVLRRTRDGKLILSK